MSIALEKHEFMLLKQLIESECGICLNEDKVYLVEGRLNQVACQHNCASYSQLYHKMHMEPTIKNQVIDAMTTNETLWFRDQSFFTALDEYFLPEFVDDIRTYKKPRIRIWSAACSTGQEPYSVAISCQEFANQGKGAELCEGKLSILATDISPTVLNTARNGQYDALSMQRGMPCHLKSRYFQEEAQKFTIQEKIKRLIRFEQFNLMEPFTGLEKFDLILLRNVAIYFAEDVQKALFSKMAQALIPEGYLVLGGAESLWPGNKEFISKQYKDFTFYQRKPSF